MNYTKFSDLQAATKSIANEILTYSQSQEPMHISLSGGSTPKPLFELLATAEYATKVNWNQIHFWWGDERCVSPEDRESNYGEVKNLLLDHINIPTENVHRIRGENDPQAEAVRLSDEIKAFVKVDQDGIPAFDWIILGMGDDGHTASLFPNQTDYADKNLTVVATQPQSGQLRVSKTALLLEHAKRITYYVAGEKKANILREIQQQEESAKAYPAAQIKSLHGKTEWFLDALAASKLD